MQPNTELLDAVRLISEQAALADIDPQVTAEVVDLLEQARARLAPVREELPRSRFEAPAEAREREDGKWLAGGFNPLLPQVELQFSGESVRCAWTAGPLDEGPPGLLHGGLSAYLMDVLSGVLIQSLGIRAVTAYLNMSYRRFVPLRESLDLSAHVERVDGRKIFVKGQIRVRGETAVESDGLFVELPPDSHLVASPLKH